MITGAQIKAARALLGWSQAQLSELSKVSLKTIARAEGAEVLPEGWATSAMIKTLEESGIAFTNDFTSIGVTLTE